MGEELFVKLRDCFTAGYTLPQYCIDNKIKRPLIVSEKKHELFLWEIYVQFRYDKRIFPQFCFIDSELERITFSSYFILGELPISNISQVNPKQFDAVIALTQNKVSLDIKIIYLGALTKHFISKAYLEIPLLHFMQRHPDVKLFTTILPTSIYRYKDGREFANNLPFITHFQRELQKNINADIVTPLDKFGYTHQEVLEMISLHSKVTTSPDGTTVLKDNPHPLIKIKDGKRETAYQPEHYKNKIYFVGVCYYVGAFAPYDKSIESHLQAMLNEHNLPYRVENEGQYYGGRHQDIFYNLSKLNPAPDDIIFIWHAGNLTTDSFRSIDLSDTFDPPHDYREIFIDNMHVNERGYKLLAERFFTVLTENNFFRDKEFNYPLPPPRYHRYGVPPWVEQGGVKPEIVSEELEAYKEQLKAKRVQIGALVMNCNPFTLGHQYLVEYAAARVDKLYVFVVEEDKSEFPFADRIELVRQGVQRFSNVEVLPSGKFIISQTTFSGYFNKAELQDVQVDSSEDVEIFGREIAPTLGITVRFAGEEPTDNVTRQYNETMKEILPRYGVEFCEIPRKEINGEPISASKVRAALKVGDFDKIKTLVPDTTFKYLCKWQKLSKQPD